MNWGALDPDCKVWLGFVSAGLAFSTVIFIWALALRLES